MAHNFSEIYQNNNMDIDENLVNFKDENLVNFKDENSRYFIPEQQDFNKLDNLMTDESTPAQMDKLFLSMVEYIQQQLITVDKETYLDLTDEGLEFYNFWINKFKGIKENVK